MVEIALNDPRFRHVPRIRSTLVVKRKNIGIYKGRLCARGDSVPLTHTPSTSSPTVHRCGAKLVLTIAALRSFEIHSVDASQAFLQSDNLAESDRCIAIPPSMGPMPWKGQLHPPETNLSHVPAPTHGFLIPKPLYGTRDSPLRWFVKLSKVLIQSGLRQLKSDICMYSKIDSLGRICGFLIAHVDDLLYTGATEFLSLIKRIVSQFRVGETQVLTENESLTFTGLDIQKGPSKSLVLSQETYAKDLPIMDITQYVTQKGLRNVSELKSTFRQGVGSLIWIHQTRPDVGFSIAKLATDLIQACEDAGKADKWCKAYNKAIRFIKRNGCKIHYWHAPKTTDKCSWGDLLGGYRIVSFTDAGFASLEGDCSIESNVAVFGEMLYRDGVIHFHGYLLDHRCAKIQRVCRSSLSAECHAAVTDGDYALRYQIILNEIFTHKHQIRQLCPPTDYPMLDPFAKSPTDAALKADKLYMTESEARWNPAITLDDELPAWNVRKCESCQV